MTEFLIKVLHAFLSVLLLKYVIKVNDFKVLRSICCKCYISSLK